MGGGLMGLAQTQFNLMNAPIQQGFWETVQEDMSATESPAQTVDGMGAMPPQDTETLSFFGTLCSSL